ncbi:dienelactone hydrolase family protein [Methylobacillus arboreus]|uniref:dienelactone hydrolase family protein n=1 Tax=Methylobacillus arboreus TaxID=755170 RepID=UPI001E32BAB7|nr:dienelactone hydrolase family protein [Methylobacillus arboreus]MCB5190128.1 dienelactone hydrolase family protein [Methylobacillus arboreus]
MVRKTANDFPPEVLKAFDQYTHGEINRRGFLKNVAKFTVAGLSAEALLLALSPQFAQAQQIAPDDKRITTSWVEFPSPNGSGKVKGYLVKPAKVEGKLPVVLVVHENRGLNPHIQDIARRVALDNFIAFAPDSLAPLGGYPGDEDKARELFATLDQTKVREDFIAAATELKKLPEGNGKLGVVGFCYGGGISNFLATRLPDLNAAVPFYGAHPPAEDVAKIKAPLLVQLAEQDERITSGWPAYEAALKAANVKYQAYIYPGVQHAFNNDTTPRYDAAAAKLAWERTISFFNQHLRT